MEANERLLLAALRCDAIAEAAVNSLREAMRAGRHDLARGHLREANEQLVLAAIAAQELEADAGAAHRQPISFLAMVAHELRNPLTSILQAAELLRCCIVPARTLRDLHGCKA
ncbi:MAG: histidine kinase dimerization/phospho-acceptor domain-containing protein [Burkholderiaceae bacterium]